MGYIFSEISKVFCLLIHSQVIALKSSNILKLIQGCKLLVAKNKKSLIDTDLLFLAANLAIISFFD